MAPPFWTHQCLASEAALLLICSQASTFTLQLTLSGRPSRWDFGY